jgi:hypothetical protein
VPASVFSMARCTRGRKPISSRSRSGGGCGRARKITTSRDAPCAQAACTDRDLLRKAIAPIT